MKLKFTYLHQFLHLNDFYYRLIFYFFLNTNHSITSKSQNEYAFFILYMFFTFFLFDKIISNFNIDN